MTQEEYDRRFAAARAKLVTLSDQIAAVPGLDDALAEMFELMGDVLDAATERVYGKAEPCGR